MGVRGQTLGPRLAAGSTDVAMPLGGMVSMLALQEWFKDGDDTPPAIPTDTQPSVSTGSPDQEPEDDRFKKLAEAVANGRKVKPEPEVVPEVVADKGLMSLAKNNKGKLIAGGLAGSALYRMINGDNSPDGGMSTEDYIKAYEANGIEAFK